MTHADTQKQKKLMATAIQQGYSVEEVCKHFKRSEQTVQVACREYRVVFPRNKPQGGGGSIIIALVAEILKGTSSLTDIGRKFNVSRQYVHQIKVQMTEVGLL